MLKRKFIRHFSIYFLVSLVALSIFSTTRIMFIYADNVRDENIRAIEAFGIVKFLLMLNLFVSTFIALLSSLTEMLFFRRLSRRMSIGLRLFLDIVIRTVLIVIVIFTARNFITSVFSSIGSEVYLKPNEMFPMTIYLAFIIALCSFIVEIDRKLGPGNLWKFLTAKFYKPREEERLFMFVDLKDATTIAEKLGHLEFSRMIRDCFQDFSIVDNYQAEIYQYVGDEVVVSWPTKKGLNNNNLSSRYKCNMLLKNTSG